MDRAALLSIHAEGRLFLRSTLSHGASFHSWPDKEKRCRWDLPCDGRPGAWRDAGPEAIAPHRGGLHAAKMHALSYWTGPELYLMETARDAVVASVDDVIASSRARLVHRLDATPETWRRFALDCAEAVLDFPAHYNYLEDFRSKTRLAGNPALKAIFHHALNSYDVVSVVQSIRESESRNRLPSQRDLDRLEQTETQALIHKQGLGREVAFDYHNRAIMEALQGIGALRRLYDGTGRDPLSVAQAILNHGACAYEAAGREQMNYMVGDGHISEGLNALLKELPFRPHRTLAATDFGGLARRGFMLDMNTKLLELLDLQDFISKDPVARLGPFMQKVTQSLRNVSLSF